MVDLSTEGTLSRLRGLLEVNTFSLVVPQTPDETLQRILAYGREWRESRLPAEFRRRGIFRLDVSDPNGAGLELRTSAPANRPGFVCRIEVAACPEGSVVNGSLSPSRATYLLYGGVGLFPAAFIGLGPGAALFGVWVILAVPIIIWASDQAVSYYKKAIWHALRTERATVNASSR